MFFERVDSPCLSIHSYLIGDEKTKQCIVIDPSRHVIPFIVHAQEAGYTITDIVETHVHADFVSGAKELKHQLNNKPRIHASGMGGAQWTPAYADVVVHQGSSIQMGDLRLEALHTPGHTPEHVAWVCYDQSRSPDTPWFIFTGDSLFVGSVGRPDLLGSEEVASLGRQLYHTLFDVLGRMPDFVEIYPSHGAGSLCGKSLNGVGASTLGYERRFNPYLKKENVEQWLVKALKGLPPAPPYFLRLKKMNAEGPPLLSDLKSAHWDECEGEPQLNELFLLDVRHLEVFAASHLKNALNIPPSPSFCQWVGWMLPSEQPIGLIVDSRRGAAETIEQLRLLGFDQPIWEILFDEANPAFAKELTRFPLIDAEELAEKQASTSPSYILDVRTKGEWESGHISGAANISLVELEHSCNKLPRGIPMTLVCQSGSRSSLAASLLRKQGFADVMNLRGGMLAWKQAGLPLSKE